MGDRIVIVGAGPGGCAAAIALGRRGFPDVTLLDRARFPREKTCGSAISPLGLRVLAALGVENDVRERATHPFTAADDSVAALFDYVEAAALVLLRRILISCSPIERECWACSAMACR